MRTPKHTWMWCNREGCDAKLVFARRADAPPTRPRVPYEFEDRAPFSIEATGCHVLVAGTAWTPADLIEHYQVRYGVSEEKARELVSGYPFHRPHFHAAETTTPEGELL